MAEKQAKPKKSNGFKNAMETAALRLSLLRIWLMKNLTMFLTTVMVALLIIIATGNAQNIPFIGLLIPEELYFWGVEGDFWQKLLAMLGGMVTPVTACTIILTKARRITLADIKSVKTKKAMIKAGLYFDKEGHLAKATKDKKKKEKGTGLFSKILAPIKEFILAITAEIKNVEEIDDEFAVKADVGIKNVEEKLNEETIIEQVAPQLTDANTKLHAAAELIDIVKSKDGTTTPVKEISTDESAIIVVEPVESPQPVVSTEVEESSATIETPVVEETKPADPVDNMTIHEINAALSEDEVSVDEDDQEEEEYESMSLLMTIFTALGAAMIAVIGAVKKLFTRTPEQQERATERKAARQAKREARRLARQERKAQQAIEAEKTPKVDEPSTIPVAQPVTSTPVSVTVNTTQRPAAPSNTMPAQTQPTSQVVTSAQIRRRR